MHAAFPCCHVFPMLSMAPLIIAIYPRLLLFLCVALSHCLNLSLSPRSTYFLYISLLLKQTIFAQLLLQPLLLQSGCIPHRYITFCYSFLVVCIRGSFYLMRSLILYTACIIFSCFTSMFSAYDVILFQPILLPDIQKSI